MDPIKEAFSRIKQDISSLQEQINTLKDAINEINRTLIYITSTQNPKNPAIQQENPTSPQFPTDNLPLEGLKQPNKSISTGNEGVPTNRQTDKQTNTFLSKNTNSIQNAENNDKITQIQRVSDILESLDIIKKEIRADFKKLTKQEMAVFSAIYSLEEQGFVVDYSLISQKLGLSESSIRDYTQRIIRKGIPLLKSKENNKKIIIGISPELKKIASLEAILTLREL